MKRIITVGILFIVLGTVAIGIWYVYGLLNPPTPVSPINPEAGGFPIGTVSTSTMPGYATSTESGSTARLTISDAQFDALKTKWDTFDFDGFLVGTSTNDYSIAYTRKIGTSPLDLLQINVISEPEIEVQKEAEAEILRAYGMSQEEVCRMNVKVFWKTWSTDNLFEEHKLTFCD